jgi:uncharacterized protein YchJ
MRIHLIQTGTVKYPADRPGRNDLCPCGSGKKYKRCCMETLREKKLAFIEKARSKNKLPYQKAEA